MRGALGKNLGATGAFLALMAAAPFLLPNEYYVSILILACINAVIVVGLNLLMGYAGQISLGHAAFFGIGAYTTAILTTTFLLPIPVGMAAGVALAAAVAWFIGIPTLKLKGNYLAMATLGFGVIVYIVFNETVEWTGGPSGFVGIPRLDLLGYAFDTDRSYYYLLAVVLAIVALFSLNLIDSRTGRALRAVHVSENAALAAGIDIAKYKLFIFVLSAVFAALAGVLYAHYLCFVAPASFGFHFSVQLVVMVVLGGMASVWGSIAGAFFLTALPEFLRGLEDIDIIIYGAILLLCVMFLPDGVAGGLSKAVKALRTPKTKNNEVPAHGDRR